MSIPLDPPPYKTALIESSLLLTSSWTRWFSLFWERVISGVQAVATVTKTNQSAAILTTQAYVPIQNGVIRISTYLRITTADGVSSSAQVTLTWREGSQTCTKTFAAVTGDAVTSVDSQTWCVRADSGTAISYAVAYASNTPQKMRYRFDLTVEVVS